jgi:hypothetical protein
MSVFNNDLYKKTFNVADEQTQYDLLLGQFETFTEGYNAELEMWNAIGTSATYSATPETIGSGLPQVLVDPIQLPIGVYLVYVSGTATANGDNSPSVLGFFAQLLNDDGTSIQPDTNDQAEFCRSDFYLQQNDGNNNNSIIAHQHVCVMNGFNPLYSANEYTNIEVGCKISNAGNIGTCTPANLSVSVTRLK